MSPSKTNFYYAQARKCPLNRRWQWMATWPIVFRYGDRCQILIEHPSHQYRVDIYFPALNLAIEIDEKHHNSPENAASDAERQAAIEQDLACTFRRVKVEGAGGSLYAQLAALTEYLDEQTRDVPNWEGPKVQGKRAQPQRPSGQYSEDNLRLLEAAGIPGIVAHMVEQLSALGIATRDIGEPLSPGSGEMGFAIDLPGINFVVSVRPNGSIKTLVVGDWQADVKHRLDIELIGPKKPESKNRYWEVVGMRRPDLSIDQTLTRLIQFNDVLTNPGAKPAAEGE